MFDDRLELYSPGGLCNSMTTDDLRTSQFTRNELLASRLGQCPVGDVPGAGGRRCFVERRGEGIGVIQDETFALAGEHSGLRVDWRAGTEGRPSGRAAAGVRRRRGSRRGPAQRHGAAAAGRRRADALSQQDVSGGADRRPRARGVRALRQAADDRVLRRAGIHGPRGARLSARRASGGSPAAGRRRGIADHREPNEGISRAFRGGSIRSSMPWIAPTSTRTTWPSTTAGPSGAFPSERAGSSDGFAGRPRHVVVSRDGWRVLRVRLPVHGLMRRGVPGRSPPPCRFATTRSPCCAAEPDVTGSRSTRACARRLARSSVTWRRHGRTRVGARLVRVPTARNLTVLIVAYPCTDYFFPLNVRSPHCRGCRRHATRRQHPLVLYDVVPRPQSRRDPAPRLPADRSIVTARSSVGRSTAGDQL